MQGNFLHTSFSEISIIGNGFLKELAWLVLFYELNLFNDMFSLGEYETVTNSRYNILSNNRNKSKIVLDISCTELVK